MTVCCVILFSSTYPQLSLFAFLVLYTWRHLHYLTTNKKTMNWTYIHEYKWFGMEGFYWLKWVATVKLRFTTLTPSKWNRKSATFEARKWRKARCVWFHDMYWYNTSADVLRWNQGNHDHDQLTQYQNLTRLLIFNGFELLLWEDARDICEPREFVFCRMESIWICSTLVSFSNWVKHLTYSLIGYYIIHLLCVF